MARSPLAAPTREFYPDWDAAFAVMCVAIMRAEAARNPHDRAFQDLVGELPTQSETFRRLWEPTTSVPTAPEPRVSTAPS